MSKAIKKLLKNEKGFTMIELMIVIIIIGVLAAIAVPVYSEASQKSKISRAQADLRTLESALEIYNAENNGYPAKNNLKKELVPDYIKELPVSPWSTDENIEYYSYDGNGKVYLEGTDKNGIGTDSYLYSSGIKKKSPSS